MQNRKTTAQINSDTLARLKQLAKEKNKPLYALLDAAVIEYLNNHAFESYQTDEEIPTQKSRMIQRMSKLYPLKGKNKWITTGLSLLGWYIYTALQDS